MEEALPFGIIGLMFVVLMFCVPFFIYKIRNQVVEMNKKMVLMTEYLRMIAYDIKQERSLDNKGREIKACPKCGKPNRPKDLKCIYCGEALV